MHVESWRQKRPTSVLRFRLTPSSKEAATLGKASALFFEDVLFANHTHWPQRRLTLRSAGKLTFPSWGFEVESRPSAPLEMSSAKEKEKKKKKSPTLRKGRLLWQAGRTVVVASLKIIECWGAPCIFRSGWRTLYKQDGVWHTCVSRVTDRKCQRSIHRFCCALWIWRGLGTKDGIVQLTDASGRHWDREVCNVKPTTGRFDVMKAQDLCSILCAPSSDRDRNY